MNEIPQYKSLHISQSGKVATITLHRPGVHNAFDLEMIKELYDIFSRLANDNQIRCIILTGAGKSFCAGADLNWFKDVSTKSYRDVFSEVLHLSKLLYLIFTHPKPVIAKINGAAIGGGVGLAIVSDIAVAVDTANFGLSEVKLGIIPSVIAPYLMKRIGEMVTKEYFLTGERISATKAYELKLVNYVLPEDKIDSFVNDKVKALLSSAPGCIASTKQLFAEISTMRYDEILQYTTELMAKSRISDEGNEGMTAFLEKRYPSWFPESR